MDKLINNSELRLWWQLVEWVNGNGILVIEKSISRTQMQDTKKQKQNGWEATVMWYVRREQPLQEVWHCSSIVPWMQLLCTPPPPSFSPECFWKSVCFLLLNYTFHLHSCCRLSYRRPSMWTAMCWLSPTTCSYTTIPSMGEGLADSTLQKVRLLIWRMVGTFLHLMICYAPFFRLIVSFRPPTIFFFFHKSHT